RLRRPTLDTQCPRLRPVRDHYNPSAEGVFTREATGAHPPASALGEQYSVGVPPWQSEMIPMTQVDLVRSQGYGLQGWKPGQSCPRTCPAWRSAHASPYTLPSSPQTGPELLAQGTHMGSANPRPGTGLKVPQSS